MKKARKNGFYIGFQTKLECNGHISVVLSKASAELAVYVYKYSIPLTDNGKVKQQLFRTSIFT